MNFKFSYNTLGCLLYIGCTAAGKVLVDGFHSSQNGGGRYNKGVSGTVVTPARAFLACAVILICLFYALTAAFQGHISGVEVREHPILCKQFQFLGILTECSQTLDDRS